MYKAILISFAVGIAADRFSFKYVNAFVFGLYQRLVGLLHKL